MSYFLYFASLVTIIVLAILFQEYRKLAGTKAVLSRLATKNGWKITFREAFFELEADLSLPSANQESWELTFKTERKGISVVCRSLFSADFREHILAQDLEFVPALNFYPERTPQEWMADKYTGPHPPVFRCNVTK